MNRFEPARDNLHAAGREIYRTVFLTWRIPLAAFHARRAERHRRLAQHHHDHAMHTAHRAVELSTQHPSLYWQNRPN